MANNLVGLFDDRSSAQGAVTDLMNAGIDRSRISIITNDDQKNTATTMGVDESGNIAGQGLEAGATSGAVVGGIAGLLIGAGFTFLPVAGFLLAGPIAGLLTGAVAGAATGGVLGGLIGLGIPRENAELYAEGIRRGGTLVTVQVESDEESRARDILNRDGAVDIDRRSSDWRSQGYTGYDANAKPYTSAEIADERNRYATSSINSDWNDTANAPAPSTDATYTGSNFTPGSDVVGSTGMGTNGMGSNVTSTMTPSNGYIDPSMADVDWNDDSSYREHFDQTYSNGDYDRHAPAYAYGRDLANDPTYGSADWDANESRFRSTWEDRNPGTWDEFKSSVRHAYDRAKNAVTGRPNNASMR